MPRRHLIAALLTLWLGHAAAADPDPFEGDPYQSHPWVDMRKEYLGATAKTVVNREDFGLTWNAALESGGVLVGKDVTITLDLQGSVQA